MAADCDCGRCCDACGHYPGCISGKGRNEINNKKEASA